ncbi:MAG: hypothetical protein B7C24_00295 [Bacteroidetes bacterium 4572_77]|nr:MAG: hypothetical protein B7C24_00295 [Bacteroidetes bacterium 4572_77]
MKLKILISCFLMFFFLLFPTSLWAQEEEILEEEILEEVSIALQREQIDLSEFVKRLNSGEQEIVFSDLEIISSIEDKAFLIDKVFFSLYEIELPNTNTKKIYFYNCVFNLANKAPLILKDWSLDKLNLVSCKSFSPVSFEGLKQSSNYAFLIENCVFMDEWRITNNKEERLAYIFRNNQFYKQLNLQTSFSNLLLEKNIFLADTLNYAKLDKEKTHYLLEFEAQENQEVKLLHNHFNSNGFSNVFSVNMQFSSFEKLSLIANKMHSLNFTEAKVEKSLLIDSLMVEAYIGILNFDFPDKNTNASWYNIAQEKLALFITEPSGLILPYQAKTNDQLNNNLLYNDLMSSYNKFNELYHNRGDIVSANASYVEIKDIETRKQAYVQNLNPTINNLINYKLNVFLRFFSDYATNPGKSLTQSLIIILIFTFLYMISFSRWDGINYLYLLNQYNRFAQYIIGDDKIETIFGQEEEQLEDEVNTLKKKYIDSGKDIPRILYIFGGPLHFLGKFRSNILAGLIRFFNFQPQKWKDLKGFKKTGAGFLILFIALLFLLYVFLVKFLNSFVLSINSFVVIGFGGLPEEDNSIAMYLSIIEAIIGWFLLTIFTITLLSQVLQSA